MLHNLALLTLSSIAGLLAMSALLWVARRIAREPERPGIAVYGEVVFIPAEMRPARKGLRRGDGPETNGLADTHNHADASYQRPRGAA